MAIEPLTRQQSRQALAVALGGLLAVVLALLIVVLVALGGMPI